MTYYIKRHYAPGVDKSNEIIRTGLTLNEAQEHCEREDTSLKGEWFDGYYKEDEE
jgi:hypothetical protein